MNRLSHRVERLEQRNPSMPYNRAFLWPQGQSLDDALAVGKVTLEDGPLLAIKLVAPGVTCPFHERDSQRL